MSSTVLIFDSGLGGISIFQAIQQQFPSCQLIYCSDNEAFPYGTKTEKELIARVSRVIQQLHDEYKPDIIVIACNTASTVALPSIRELIKTPIVGVVPAIKPAAAIAKSPCIGLLATPGTVNRAYTASLIKEFAPDFDWIKVGSSELVQLVENKMYGQAISRDALENIVRPFADYTSKQLDTMVLACTHFPLIKKELKQVLPHIVNWIDSTEAIANRVAFFINKEILELSPQEQGSQLHEHQLVFTKELDQEKNISALMKELGIKKISTLKIECSQGAYL